MTNNQILQNYIDNHLADFTDGMIDTLYMAFKDYPGYSEDMLIELDSAANKMLSNDKVALAVKANGYYYVAIFKGKAHVDSFGCLRCNSYSHAVEFANNFACSLQML